MTTGTNDLGGGHSPRELDPRTGTFVDDGPSGEPTSPTTATGAARPSAGEQTPHSQIDTYGRARSALASLLGKRASGNRIAGAAVLMALLGIGWGLISGGSRRRRVSWLDRALARPARRRARRVGFFGARF